jgi:hypothetical protein
MKKSIILTIITLISTSSFSQIKIENFAFMQGNWAGVLEYTDYQDDKSKVQLKTTACFAQQFDKIVSHYTYVEPDGSLVYDKGQISIIKKGNLVSYGGEKLEITKNTEGVLILEGQGEDNNKKATIRETIHYNKDSLSILKDVKYDGEKVFLNRHEYRFQRESSEMTKQRLLKDLMATWTLDLRPTPQSDSYLKEFVLSSFEEEKLNGTFYGTDFKDGKINCDWGKIYFSFTTGDNSGPYFHTGYVENGKIYGTSYSEGRGFMIPWFGEKKKK